MQELIEWVKAHPAETIIYVIAFSRLVVKYTPTDVDNKILAAILGPVIEIAKFFGIVIPPDKVDPTVPVGVPVGIIREVSTGAILPRDRAGGRPLLRAVVRRIAKARGLDTSQITDDEIDDVIAEATHNAGPIKDLLSWIFANPEAIVALLKLLLMFAGDKPNDAHEVTT